MTIWAVETGGRALLAFPAETQAEAEDVIKPDGAIAEDLVVMEDRDGVPLWDGESSLVLREAEAEEQEVWDSMVASAVSEGEVDSREEALKDGYVVFLVPCSDPTDDDPDDDEED